MCHDVRDPSVEALGLDPRKSDPGDGLRRPGEGGDPGDQWRREMTLRRWIVCTLILTTGCATSGSSGATANTLPPCQVEVDESRDWRQVTSDVVSFCVPAGWTSLGRNEWLGRGGSIRWGTGPQPRGVGTPPNQLPSGQERRFTEVIGGVSVDLWISRVESRFHTGAEWRTPREVHMNGTASSRAAAELQLDIFRTARPRGSPGADLHR